ncbi:LysR family transcriptional regulator [Granulosicoccaceae sp. 1_MG-2023]|nr:LysR family transcriptional regulator [Granulosicoccaceae sp. 1_MG-2023]
MSELHQQFVALAQALDGKRRLAKRLRLLEAIAGTGSLTAAAGLLGVSYKTAWNHLQELNRESGAQIVATRTGGASGGSSQLTADGQMLLAQLRLQRQRSDQPPAERVPALSFSARNQLPARVLSVEADDVLARIGLVAGGIRLCSLITRSSIDRLGLRVGAGAYAIFKASALDLMRAEYKSDNPDMNIMPARVLCCNSSAQGREIELALNDQLSLTVARRYDQAEDVWLCDGARAQVLIHPREIMLATTA